MNEERRLQIVRQFPENGMKQVLSSPGNVRDLLELTKAKMLSRIEFQRMEIDRNTRSSNTARSTALWRA